MAATSPQNRSASEPPINRNQDVDSDSDTMEITEAEWRSAPRVARISKSAPPATSAPSTNIKAEPDEAEVVNQVVVSSPAAAPATPVTKKRARLDEEPSIAENSGAKDVRIKNEPRIKRESSAPPFSRDISTPPKRRKSLFQNTPFSHMTSTSTQREVDNEEEAQNSEFEFDREATSESESEWEPADAQPQVNEKPKKPRAKSVKTAREWWVRCYKTKANFGKVRNRRIFANDGAASKVHNFMNHNPIASHNHAAKKDVAPDVVASSKQSYFDQVTSNIRTDGRIHHCRGDRTALKVAGESFGRGNVKFDKEDLWMVKGMKSSLYHYQLLCVSWMLGREFDPEGPSGGFNCDVMGLGKTVEVLATIIGNPRPVDAPRKEVGPTLIVCPSSISLQWRAEIGKHIANDDLNVVVYRKSQKLERQAVQNADIVVTTYHQLLMSCPWPTKEWFAKLARSRAQGGGSIDEETDIEEWICENRKDLGGVLHQISWYRIVLDEAHNIKNHSSRTSHAANALLGQFRWVVTGTPMMNRRSELYSYFRFLKDIKTTPTFAKFKQAYCNDKNELCNSRLDAVLSRLVIRRTMQSRIMDREIVTLPTPHRKDVTIEFDPVTEVLYQAVEQKFRELIQKKNCSDSKTDPRTKLKYAIIMTLRLRQFIASPVLIEPQMKIMFDAIALREVQKRMREVCPELHGAGLALHDRITMWIDDLEYGRETPNSYKLSDVDECCLCYDMVQNPQQIRGCGHIFCGACIEDDIRHQTARDDTLHCPECSQTFLYERLKSIGESPKAISKAAKKGRDTLGFVPRIEIRSEWLEEFDKGKALLPRSAKVEAIRDKLRTWKNEAPSDKVIIFVQWSLMIRLIGIMLEEERVSFIYYVGEMTQSERADTLKSFEKTAEVTVLLIGLKVGGVGLNLTCANRAIMVDLWWNSAVENQANSRIYRIGQDKETHFARFMMRRSVDIRLLQMQILKSAEIDGTLTGKRSLSEKDALSFLGEVIQDEKGRVTIISDYQKLDDWLEKHLNKQGVV